MKKIKNKTNNKKSTWNLTPLFGGDNDPKMATERKVIERENYKFINKWKGRNDYLKNPKVLREALDEYEKLQRKHGTAGKEGYYFRMRASQNQNDSKIKAKVSKIEDFSKKISNDIQFFQIRLSKIGTESQKKFLADKELSPYKHFLEGLFAEAKYLLGESEEKIMTLKGSVAHSNWVKMVSGFLAKEKREVVLENGKKEAETFSGIASLINSQNKKVRDSAASAFNDILEKHSDVAEAEINSILANKKVDDELRKLPRPDSVRHLSDDVESVIVDKMIDAVSGRFDVSRKYYKLKAKLLSVEKLKYHERNVPVGNADRKYPYTEATSLVGNVLKNVDKQFGEIFGCFSAGGNIDVYPAAGKKSGAFCAYELMACPTYILLNYTDKLNDVLTLAHEVGHGINDELMKKKQNSLNFGTPLSTAEVASTFMEDFVLEEILKGADDELRLSIMMAKLNDDVSTIFRQVACYKFEQELHFAYREKGYLSKQEVGKIFQKHMSAYMGEGVEQSTGAENWWVYWPHIRRFFYVYSYASGLLISKSLQTSLKKDHKFIEKIKGFLSAGRSDSPKNIFKKLGVDISDKKFWEAGLKEVDALLRETEILAKKLGKI